MSLFQPVGQKRLTNVAVVRLKRGGSRFEVACYKNKCLEWRAGVEKDLDEVLQTTQVYENVSKGLFAKPKNLRKAFGTEDMEAICTQILTRGELQVSDKERAKRYDELFHEVATTIVEKCVNPESGRPYPAGVVERAMRDAHFNVDPNRSAKQQAMELVPRLAERIPLARAPMRLRLVAPAGCEAAEFEAACRALGAEAGKQATVESAEGGPEGVAVVLRCDPSVFAEADRLCRSLEGGQGRVEVVDLAVHEGGADSMGLRAAKADDGLAAALSEKLAVGGGGAGAGGGNGGQTAPPRARPALSCVACRATFATREEHREHFRCDWHRANLKRKQAKQPPLSREEHEAEALMAGDELDDFDKEFL